MVYLRQSVLLAGGVTGVQSLSDLQTVRHSEFLVLT